MSICAAFDIGTNTSDLVVVRKEECGSFSILKDEELFIRLGESVDRNGYLLDSAIERTLRVLSQQLDQARELGATRFRLAGTSASRDASNSDILVAKIKEQFGVEFRVISGDDEAAHTFRGAVTALKGEVSSALVFDIGGGSTEFSWGQITMPKLEGLASIQAGAIRISERFFSSIPPSKSEIKEASACVDELIISLNPQIGGSRTLIASAGSTPAKLADLIRKEQGQEQNSLIDLSIDYETVIQWMNEVSQLGIEEILSIQNGTLRGRERYFLSGIIVLESILRVLGFDRFLVSSGGVGLGIALAEDW